IIGRHCCDDGHRKFAIRVDALHKTDPGASARLTGRGAMDIHLIRRPRNLVDIIGPRFMLGLGSIMVGLGWVGSGYAETINGLYFWYGVGGIGAGIVYGGAIGNALKWFPDHRGLCVGLTAG